MAYGKAWELQRFSDLSIHENLCISPEYLKHLIILDTADLIGKKLVTI